MFYFKNYNKFLVGTPESFRWEDFYIHRFSHDIDKLVKFPTYQEAVQFLEQHPEIEEDFDAWVLELKPEDWNGSIC